MKKQRTALVSKGIMILLSLIVLAFISSYSWFAPPDTPAISSGLSVKAESNPDFDIAVGFPYNYSNNYGMTDYSSTFDLGNLHDTITDKDYSLFTYFSAKDITSDGVSSFWRPALTKDTSEGADTKALVPTGGQGAQATQGKEYLSFDLYFRSSVPNLKVMLSSGSRVLGRCEGSSVNLSSFTNPSEEDKSTYGNFSKDVVAGAVRASFVGYSTFSEPNNSNYINPAVNSHPTLFWLPRPDVYLNAPIGDSNSWTVLTGSQITSAMATDVHYFYTNQGGAWTQSSYSSADSFFVAGTPDDNELVTLDHQMDEYYYSKIHVNLWVEGSDPETRRAISGGKFNFNLEFSSQ